MRTCSIAVRVLSAALLASASGCSSSGGRSSRYADADTRDPKTGEPRASSAAVQSEVMSFTDTFISAVSQQWNKVGAEGRATSDPSGLASFTAEQELPSRQRRAALENKLANVSAALAIASSPNPRVAVADLITMITLQRMVLEAPAAQELYGAKNGPALVAAYREQEDKAWRMAERTMSKDQQDDLREAIETWRQAHPSDTYVVNVRLEDFARSRQQTFVRSTPKTDTLLSLLSLDPLAGLDPAEREVAKTRLLAERVFYYASRSPQIIKWQVESLYQDLLRAPEFKQALASMEKANESAARISTVAEQLPSDLAAERKNALDQFFKQLADERHNALEDVNQHVTQQRQDLVKQLDDAQGNLQGTLREYKDAAAATDKMAASLTATIHAADDLAAKFNPGQPPDPNEPKKDAMADFRATALQASDTADRLASLTRDLGQLLNSPGLNSQTSALHSVVLDVNANSRQIIDFAFWRLLILVLAAPFAIALAAGLYRWKYPKPAPR